MTRKLKWILISMVVICCAFYLQAYSEHYVFHYENGTPLKDFEQDFGKENIQLTTKVEASGLTVVIAKRNLALWRMPSGPAIYVFSTQDKLIGCTSDSGDDLLFLRQHPYVIDILSSIEYGESTR